MKEGYVIRDQTKIHFLTITVVYWIDIFTRKAYRDDILSSLEYCIQNKGMLLFGYVIMSNHVHFIVQSKDGELSNLIRDFKKFTATTILNRLQTEPEGRREWMLGLFKDATQTHSRNKNFQFWQYGNHAIEIYSEIFLWSKLDYIHLNPVRAGLVSQASAYLYSSASNYVNGKGLTNLVIVVDNPIVNTNTKDSFHKYLVKE